MDAWECSSSQYEWWMNFLTHMSLSKVGFLDYFKKISRSNVENKTKLNLMDNYVFEDESGGVGGETTGLK